MSNKLFKEEFKFRFIVLSTVEELHEYIDTTQLTPEFGGTLLYKHDEWIKQRIVSLRLYFYHISSCKITHFYHVQLLVKIVISYRCNLS